MEKEILERIRKIEVLIHEMEQFNFSDLRINNLTLQYKLLLKYINKFEKTSDMIKLILDAHEELCGEALYIFDEYTTYDDDLNAQMKKNSAHISIIKQLKNIEQRITQILNTLHYLDFHIDELNIMLNKLEQNISLLGINDNNILSILDIVDKLNKLVNIYEGIYYEILNLDEYSYELRSIDDMKFIKLVQRVIKMEIKLKGFSIIFNNINKTNSVDANTFNYMSDNEEIKLRKTPNKTILN